MKRMSWKVTKRVDASRLHAVMRGDMARLVKGGAIVATATADEIARRAKANAPVLSGRYRASIERSDLRGTPFAGARAPYSARLESTNRPSAQAPRGIFDPERERIKPTVETIMTNVLRGLALGTS